MARIVVDPITRIEGHLRIEVAADGGRISDAWSSGTMFRGLELVVRDRDPREAWFWLQRICAVCTTVHAMASVRAVENALGIEVPENALLVRNLIDGVQMVHDHVVHFYHLHALDWIDVAKALKADPAATAKLAESLSAWPVASATHFKAIQDKVRAIVESGQLTVFASGYWGHPAYRTPPEVDLLAVSHYLDALDFQRDFIRAHAVLGAKNPHLQTFLVGGMSTALDPASPQAPLNPERLAFIAELVGQAKQFVEQVYIPDLLAIAGLYPDWFTRGEGTGNFLAYGGCPEHGIGDPATYYQAGGVIRNRDLSKVEPFSPESVTENVTHSWYEGSGSRHPFDGETRPHYTGPEPPYEQLTVEDKYSWLKAPRYQGAAMEVGPLARMLVGYASGREDVKKAVDGVLETLKAPATALFSTLGRTAARGIETLLMVNHMGAWLDRLRANMERGSLQMHDGSKWEPSTWQQPARGFGRHEAPRGGLGHWIEIDGNVIRQYQVIAPSTWNASPRDEKDQRGAYEAALVGHELADPTRPLEILRTIHSFDPCLACAVQVTDARGRAFMRVPSR
jgi:Ni,Fe-hydrogenase I large subunit